MSDVIFDEDTTMYHPLPPENQIPETGFEGWFYKKFPGGYFFKKAILYSLVLLLFATSLFFIALARFNVQTSKLDFEDRTNQTTE